jgi:hypothetical protein
MSRIEPGDVMRLTITLVNKLTGALGDPGTLTFTMNAPGVAPVAYAYGTNPEVVRESVGVYYIDWLIDSAGTHRYSWKSTGSLAGVEEGSFVAKPLRVVAAAP